MASHDNLLREVGEAPRIIPVEIAENEGALKRLGRSRLSERCKKAGG